MGELQKTVLAATGRIVTGRTPPAAVEQAYGGNTLFITPSDMDGRRTIDATLRSLSQSGRGAVASCIITEQAVLVSCIGSDMGKTVIAHGPFVTNQQINSVIVNDNCDYLLLYYNLMGRRDELRRLASGAAQPILNKSDFGRLPIALPCMAEQKAVASVLGALDDKIDLNRRMNETLEAMARAIFKDWFVDFGPTRAKMEGRAPYLAPDVWALFPDRLDEAGNPKGWKSTVLEEVLAELETGLRPKGGIASYLSGVPSVGAESIVGLGKFDFAKTKYVPREFFASMNRGHVKSRDILLYKDGGRPGEFEPHLTMFGDGFPFDEFAINEHVYRLRADDAVGQAWLFFWLSSDLVMEEMRIKGTGVAIPGLNSTQVKTLTTLLPNRALVARFNETVEPLVARVLSNCVEMRTLAATRDLLLPKLMSGEIRVRDIEKVAEAAL